MFNNWKLGQALNLLFVILKSNPYKWLLWQDSTLKLTLEWPDQVGLLRQYT